jgi:hypothetical protein
VPFTDPIVGGTTLIRSAIHSPDYVPGISGWTINKDGTCEFNDATFRGDVVVTDASGAQVAIITNNGGKIEFTPPNIPGMVVSDPGLIFSSANTVAGGQTFTTVNSPDAVFSGNGVSSASLFLGSSNADGSPPNSFDTAGSLMEFNGHIEGHGDLHIEGKILAGDVSAPYSVPIVQQDIVPITFAAATSFNTIVNFTRAFPAGVVPQVYVNIASGSGQTRYWQVRADTFTNSSFRLQALTTDAAAVANAWTAINVSYTAIAVQV